VRAFCTSERLSLCDLMDYVGEGPHARKLKNRSKLRGWSDPFFSLVSSVVLLEDGASGSCWANSALVSRAAAAEEEKRLKEIQDRKKREREDAKLKSIVPRGEEEDRALALRRKRQRLLPEGELTLQKISDYANAVYEEGLLPLNRFF
jgi:uncharacterized membrane protein YdbT with pleckstrin-like domain